MQNGKVADRLTGRHPTDRDLSFLDHLNQLPILWRHGIPAQPDFADFEVPNHAEQAIHVIVMRVRQNDGIQLPDSAPKQIWRYDALADRKRAFVPKIEKP